MAIIICGSSAWQYWRTPPVLRDACIDPDVAVAPIAAGGLGIPKSLISYASNAREADKLIRGRLLTDLKGLSTPVQAMVAVGTCSMRATLAVRPQIIPAWLSLREHTVNLGNGLSILTPEATLLTLGTGLGPITIAKMMFEACGIFSLAPHATRLVHTLCQLVSDKELLDSLNAAPSIYGCSDENGRPLSFLDARGRPLPWKPCIDLQGNMADMWRRPPLTSVEDLSVVAKGLVGAVGIEDARRALRLVADGAASPAEVYSYLLLCTGARQGSESLRRPDLNRRIILSPEARMLAHRAFCIGDLVWDDQMCVLEVLGEAYHADNLGYKVDTARRPALESMGYEVQELMYEQLANLELFDAVLPSLARRLGFKLQKRTVAFLRRRQHLHDELFRKPYEPDSRGWPKVRIR